jgi:hypothetical protein
MGFLFRIEQIAVTEETTVLTGYLISGSFDWQQQIEIQIEEEMNTVFTAPLRGVALSEDPGFTLFDPSSWENMLTLPLVTSRELRISLILDGASPSGNLPVPAIAVGSDATPPTSADGMQTAFQPADAVVCNGVNVGAPVREYTYGLTRHGMLRYAPWSLLALTLGLSCVYVVGVFNKSPLQRLNFDMLIVFSIFGFFDLLFLYLTIKMLLAKPSQIVVTTTGITMPIILPDFSSRNVYVSYGEMNDMLEHWHNGAVQMLKLKTARGVLHLNGLLMQTCQFEELRRLLWRRIRDKRVHLEQSGRPIQVSRDVVND